jgi:hypothetical protein
MAPNSSQVYLPDLFYFLCVSSALARITSLSTSSEARVKVDAGTLRVQLG